MNRVACANPPAGAGGRDCGRAGGLLAVLIVFAVCALGGAAGAAGAAGPAEQNVIQSIKRTPAVPGGAGRSVPGVEIEVTSSRAFPVRDEITVLRIGAREFSLSRSPSDGSPKTLFFSLTDAQFASVKNGETVLVYYGAYDPKNSAETWDLGKLNKELLGKTP